MNTLADEHRKGLSEQIRLVVVEAGRHRVLIPLEHVKETMRPLAIQPLRETLPFVLGMSIIRGSSVPVVDLLSLLGREEHETKTSQRFVCLVLEGRTVALAVDAVVRIVEYPAAKLAALPALLQHAAGGVIEGLCLADSELQLLLSSSKMLEATNLPQETAAP